MRTRRKLGCVDKRSNGSINVLSQAIELGIGNSDFGIAFWDRTWYRGGMGFDPQSTLYKVANTEGGTFIQWNRVTGS